MNPGVVLALAAYLLWGAFPLYFVLVKFVPTAEMLAHRVLWSLAFVAILLTFAQRWAWLPKLGRQPRTLRIFAVSAALLSINWGLYFYAVSHGRIVDASLGYFINPLVSVLLGSVVLHERLRAPQWIAVAFVLATRARYSATSRVACASVPTAGRCLSDNSPSASTSARPSARSSAVRPVACARR